MGLYTHTHTHTPYIYGNAWKLIIQHWNLIIQKKKLISKLGTKADLVLFVVQKLYIKYKNVKDGLCERMHNSS